MRGRLMRLIAMIVLALLILGCDQASKAVARASLDGKEAVSLFDGVLVLRYVENQGAFLSLGSWLPKPLRSALFIVFPIAMLAAMTAYGLRKRDVRLSFALGISLIAGGGLGNLVDRLLHDGSVGDFINLGIGGLRTGVFNLADLAIMCGCVFLLFGDRPARQKQA